MSARTRWGFDRASAAKARPRPLVRAYRGAYPILTHRTMTEVMRDEALGVSTTLDTNGKREALKKTEAPKKTEAKPRIKSGVTEKGQYPVRAVPPVQVSAPVVVVSDPLPNLPSSARVPLGKIALADAPSGMERAAREWIKPATRAALACAPVPESDGKVWCGGCDARVPAWFGRDCISSACDLKGRT